MLKAPRREDGAINGDTPSNRSQRTNATRLRRSTRHTSISTHSANDGDTAPRRDAPLTTTFLENEMDPTDRAAQSFRDIREPANIEMVRFLMRIAESLDYSKCDHEVKSHSPNKCVIDFKVKAPRKDGAGAPILRMRTTMRRIKSAGRMHGKTRWEPHKATYTIRAETAGAYSARRKTVRTKTVSKPLLDRRVTTCLEIICNSTQRDSASIYNIHEPQEIMRLIPANGHNNNSSFFCDTLLTVPGWFDAANGVLWPAYPSIDDMLNTPYIYAGETCHARDIQSVRTQYIQQIRDVDLHGDVDHSDDAIMFGDIKIVTYCDILYVLVYTYRPLNNANT